MAEICLEKRFQTPCPFTLLVIVHEQFPGLGHPVAGALRAIQPKRRCSVTLLRHRPVQSRWYTGQAWSRQELEVRTAVQSSLLRRKGRSRPNPGAQRSGGHWPNSLELASQLVLGFSFLTWRGFAAPLSLFAESTIRKQNKKRKKKRNRGERKRLQKKKREGPRRMSLSDAVCWGFICFPEDQFGRDTCVWDGPPGTENKYSLRATFSSLNKSKNNAKKQNQSENVLT